MRMAPALALIALALPAGAQERALSPDEFAAMVTGRTLRFDRDGARFGAEHYLDDRRVIWAFEGGACQRGIWFANPAGEICFVYEGEPGTQCWTFLEMADGSFHARPADADGAGDLVNREVSDEPLDCPAPDIGV